MKWKNISDNHRFIDGSIITQKHPVHLYECYEIAYAGKKITLSKDHILKVNISKLPVKAQEEIKSLCNGKIPLKEDIELEILGNINGDEKEKINRWFLSNETDLNVEDISESSVEAYVFKFKDKEFSAEVFVKRVPVEYEDQKINKEEYWIPVEGIAYLYNKYGSLDIGDVFITNITNVGKKECFCVSTNTGRYEMNGLVHHNSVAIQNIIQHCIAHRNEIRVALIDPKQVEFSNYKGMNGIVAVGNNTEEAVEILRIARAVMYKRNKEMQKLGLKNLTDYKPTKKTGKVFVTGREFNEDDTIRVKIDGEEKTMTAAELVDYLHEEDN